MQQFSIVCIQAVEMLAAETKTKNVISTRCVLCLSDQSTINYSYRYTSTKIVPSYELLKDTGLTLPKRRRKSPIC